MEVFYKDIDYRVVSGKTSPPKPKDDKTKDNFASRLEDWDSIYAL